MKLFFHFFLYTRYQSLAIQDGSSGAVPARKPPLSIPNQDCDCSVHMLLLKNKRFLQMLRKTSGIIPVTFSHFMLQYFRNKSFTFCQKGCYEYEI